LDRVIWYGFSGKGYEYRVFPLNTRFVDQPGNYCFCGQTSSGWSPKYFGEAESLRDRLNDRFHERLECARRNGATHVAAHINVAGRDARLAEEADLRKAFDPPCNRQ
jgi:cytosine/adenosine deaminase-related metal-dependent hydrolase